MHLQEIIFKKRVSCENFKESVFFKKLKEKRLSEKNSQDLFYYCYFNKNKFFSLKENIDYIKQCKNHFLENYNNNLNKKHLIYTNCITLAKELLNKKNTIILEPLKSILSNKELISDYNFSNYLSIEKILGFKNFYRFELENLMQMFLSEQILTLNKVDLIVDIEELKKDFEKKHNIKMNNFLLL